MGEFKRKEFKKKRKSKRVRGHVFGPKFTEPIDVLAGGAVIFLLAGCTIALMFGSGGVKAAYRNAIGVRFIAYMIFGVMLMSLGGLIITWLLVRYRRLVVGKDRIQLIGMFGRIIGQIPFSNVLEVSNGDVVNVGKLQCYILLKKRRRKDTWWPKMLSRGEEYDILIPTNIESDATAVYLHLRDAIVRKKHLG